MPNVHLPTNSRPTATCKVQHMRWSSLVSIYHHRANIQMTQDGYRLTGGQRSIPADAFHSIPVTWQAYVNSRGSDPCFLSRVTTRPNKLRHISLCKQHVPVKSFVSLLLLSTSIYHFALSPQRSSIKLFYGQRFHI